MDEVIDCIPPSHRGKAQSRKVYRVEIDRTPHYIVAGNVFASRDDGPTSIPRRCCRKSKSRCDSNSNRL